MGRRRAVSLAWSLVRLALTIVFGTGSPLSAHAQAPEYELDSAGQTVVKLSHLFPGTDCHQAPFTGRIVQRNFDSLGLLPSGFVLESQSGNRTYINVDTTSLNAPQVNMVARGWIVSGLQSLVREGRDVDLSLEFCGAAGRVAFLEGISLQVAPSSPSAITPTTRATDQIGPSFDCGAKPVANQPLAQMICPSRELAYTELSYVIAYQALREAASPAKRKAMVDDANALVIAINDQCNIAKTGALTALPSDANVQCIKEHFEQQRMALISRSFGAARDEATLEPTETIAIQRSLQAKSYLPASADIDGVFGPVTRQAIMSWQKDNGLRETGFGSKVMLAAMSARPPAASASVPAAPPSLAPPAVPSLQVDRSGKTSSIRLALADGPELRAQDVFEQVSAAVYVVKAGELMGSAVAISARELLTNCHVVRASQSVTIEREGAQLSALPFSAKPDADRCILRIGDMAPPLPKWVRVRPYVDVKIGERVFTIGAPQGLELSLAEGLVSSKRALDDVRLIQTSAPISHGSSGGGLFDSHGHLVGITTFMLKDAQNLNFAIAAEEYAK